MESKSLGIDKVRVDILPCIQAILFLCHHLLHNYLKNHVEEDSPSLTSVLPARHLSRIIFGTIFRRLGQSFRYLPADPKRKSKLEVRSWSILSLK